MPIVKGTVWKNTEDEILKAAVSKYGKNQWARISSLLVHKTPKQCKSRWQEWLDPSIKKTEWSRDEDERLLHLAKLMPTQWRTIAPIVGRTATQCLERYQKLLDDAAQLEARDLALAGPGEETQPAVAAGGSAVDRLRRLQFGDQEPNLETLPALPDAIDMDEDEKEQLSEARARLANAQGKKAKRKARERHLEESRRLSMLQKRRELKAAGVNIRLGKRRKGEMNYNVDIPFEKAPAPGFFDTSDEKDRNEAQTLRADFQHIEKKLRTQEEHEEALRKQRAREEQRRAASEDSAARKAAAVHRLREAEQLSKRRKLNLPAPQVDDAEIERIVKYGASARALGELPDDDAALQSTRQLIDSTPQRVIPDIAQLRTPRAPLQQDVVSTEARNLLAMTNTQSSLLGEENTPLHKAASTSQTAMSNAAPDANVSIRASVRATPRDSLMINAATDTATGQVNHGIAPDFVPDISALRRAIRAKLSLLPKPQNDFILAEPKENSDQPIGFEQLKQPEDAAERDRKLQMHGQRERMIRLLCHSSAVQLGLPLADRYTDQLINTDNSSTDAVRRLLAQELQSLIQYDGTTAASSDRILSGECLSVPPNSDFQMLRRAVQLVNDEINSQVSEHPISNDAWQTATDIADSYDNSRIDQLQPEFDTLFTQVQQSASAANRFEKRLAQSLDGYARRANLLSDKIGEASRALLQAAIDDESAVRLRDQEDIAARTRIDELESRVSSMRKAQRSLQDCYRSISTVELGI